MSMGFRKQTFSLEKNIARSGFFMVLPSLLVLGIFVIYPILNSGYLSLFDANLLKNTQDFAGLANYREAFQTDRFYNAVKQTWYFTGLYVPLLVVISLSIAVAIDSISGRQEKIFQSFLFLPAITSMSIVAIGWRFILDPNVGIIFAFLEKFGVPSISLLQDTDRAMPTVILISLWKSVGFNMVILLAGLKNIPNTYYEAAAIDGAGSVRSFFSIALPNLLPSLSFVLVTNLISSFQVFDQIYVLTKGGPLFSTEVLVYYIYYNGFNLFRTGYASALSCLLFCMILIVTIFQIVQFRKQEF